MYAGLNLQVAQKPDEVDVLKEEIAKELTSALGNIRLAERGVYVQASTLGALEALLDFLKSSKIPVSTYRRDLYFLFNTNIRYLCDHARDTFFEIMANMEKRERKGGTSVLGTKSMQQENNQERERVYSSYYFRRNIIIMPFLRGYLFSL